MISQRRASPARLAVFVIIVAAAFPALAQEQRPERLGLSSERLERVADLMQHRIDARAFPGAVTLVARDNRIAYFRSQGLMHLETERPMQDDAVFRIMSMTKPIVALAILMMVEEGQVRLTDPVSRFIPELQGLAVAAPSAPASGTPAPSGQAPTPAPASPRTVPAEREITIRDLLTHTSGLMSGGASSAHPVGIGAGESLADVLPRLADAPLDFQPGTRWAYSGQFGFDVLVRVVEVASGTPFDAFAQQRIFDPLGMQDTFFFPPEGDPRLATLYRHADGELEQTPDMPFVNGAYFSGGGGLFSTAEDYLRFALMLLNGGRLDDARLVSRKTVDLMTSVFVPDTLPGRNPGEAYGLGVRVITDPAARNTWLSKGSFGWSGAFNTHFFVDPEERLVGIFMTQSAFLETRQQLRDDFETAVMQALIDDPTDRAATTAERAPPPGRTFTECRNCPEMIVLPAGTFTIGSPPDEPMRRENEPRQEISIPRPFAMSVAPVTWDQWEACVRDRYCDGAAVETALTTLDNGEPDPGYEDWGRGTRPVVGVSWYDAQAFVGWLNAKAGEDDAYRLPSEAEWEYGARAGSTTAFPWGPELDHDHGNFGTHEQGRLGGKAEGRDVWLDETSPVASFPPNAFGLYDMHGNIFEWTADCYEADRAHAPADGSANKAGNCANRVFRSGTFLSNPYMQRSARRGAPYPATLRGRNYLGFRVAKTLD